MTCGVWTWSREEKHLKDKSQVAALSVLVRPEKVTHTWREESAQDTEMFAEHVKNTKCARREEVKEEAADSPEKSEVFKTTGDDYGKLLVKLCGGGLLLIRRTTTKMEKYQAPCRCDTLLVVAHPKVASTAGNPAPFDGPYTTKFKKNTRSVDNCSAAQTSGAV